MIDPIDRETETELIKRIDPNELEAHVDAFTGLERVSGTADEWRASEYVVDTLEKYGVGSEIFEYEGYISVPESGSVETTTPESRKLDSVITTAFSASTPPTGVHGDVVRVAELDGLDEGTRRVRDAIVFTQGLPTPDIVRHAETLGAKALVLESPTEGHLHEMIVSPVWGTPATDDVDELPDLPVVEVSQRDGRWLREQLDHGPVEATVTTDVTTRLETLPCPVGWIDGAESDRYFVVGNHVDSWYEGVTDNATAMAATLELARLFADQEPARGLVFGFWSAHSTGRYAGSSWYADTNWLDLRENGVAYLHIDLNGLQGADGLWYQHMAELGDEHLDAMETSTDFSIRTGDESWLGDADRPARNSDQSFWGTGLSSLLSGARLEPGTEEGGPIGGGWWWHTPEDTRDKVDLDVLTEETKLYVALASRICESPILPHDFTATVDDFHDVLDEIEEETTTRFIDARDRLDELRQSIAAANEIAEADAATDSDIAVAMEDLQVILGNELIPTLYMETVEYDHEPAMSHRRLPYLRVAETVKESQGCERRFAETSLQRGRNKLNHRLERAQAAVNEFLTAHTSSHER